MVEILPGGNPARRVPPEPKGGAVLERGERASALQRGAAREGNGDEEEHLRWVQPQHPGGGLQHRRGDGEEDAEPERRAGLDHKGEGEAAAGEARQVEGGAGARDAPAGAEAVGAGARAPQRPLRLLQLLRRQRRGGDDVHAQD